MNMKRQISIDLKDENKLYECSNSKKVFKIYKLLVIIIAILFVALITVGTILVTMEVENSWVLLAVSPVLIILAVLLYFVFRSYTRYHYVITDKHIIIYKSGAFSVIYKSVKIKDITGITYASSALNKLIGCAQIDFYNDSIPITKTVVAKILQISSSPFKLPYLDNEDALKVIECFDNIKVEINNEE